MWNDKETDVDLLGHDKIAQTVIEIINDSHLRPLTIGVYGDWGVGKSSVLSLLQKNINKSNEAGVTKTHCMIFNGWLFQGYEDAKTALMETIVSELADLQPADKKIQKLAKSLFKRINWLKVAKVASGALITGLTGLPVAGMVGSAIDLANKGKEMFSSKDDEDDDDGTNITVKTEKEESFLKESKEETVTGQIQAFRKEFKKLIETSKIDHLVVLVDDLDRCLPKSVIDILEAIRLFLFVEGTTFVISADEVMIEYAVREHFPNLPARYGDYTKNYLEKLIQIPLRIPLLNNLQTGNYIKFLMVQNHLKNDYTKLERLYDEFNKKKKTPYENVDLSYKIITDVLGTDDANLKEAIHVGGQLSPTLSVGLKGNPRNIKRFLNTLFLRMKIARIYGLEGTISLSVLAKLMILEHFQTERFGELVDEISATDDGLSKMIAVLEDSGNHKEQGSSKKSLVVTGEKADEKLKEWIAIEPQLSKVDLRPYIFISREKAIGFNSEASFPDHLRELLQKLNTSSAMLLKDAEKGVAAISLAEATTLFDALESDSRSADDLKKTPPSINGLLRIIQFHVQLEERMVSLIGSFPTRNLGVWAISELAGLKNPQAISAFAKLLDGWAAQGENTKLSAMATQTKKLN